MVLHKLLLFVIFVNKHLLYTPLLPQQTVCIESDNTSVQHLQRFIISTLSKASHASPRLPTLTVSSPIYTSPVIRISPYNHIMCFPYCNSASIRRTSMREKSQLSWKEAREEATRLRGSTGSDYEDEDDEQVHNGHHTPGTMVINDY